MTAQTILGAWAAGGMGADRLDQSATGYRWMLVSGKVITRDDQPTGVLPGRLARGAQAAPAMSTAT